jgi:phospholipid transport system substrate-binding protein
MTMIATSIRSRLPLAAGALALILILTTQAQRVTAAQDAGAFIANVGTQGIAALRSDGSSSDRVVRFQQLLQQDFDVPGIGLFALGRYRLSSTPQEQQEFFRLYPDFTIRAFSSRLDQYSGGAFRVTNRRTVGNETIVSSEIVRPDGGRVPLDWYVADIGGEYRITDVVVGGLSMKIALRDQFASWIESNGGRFSALLAVLRQQLAQAR